MLIAVVNKALIVEEIVDWDRAAVARAAIERARAADPDGSPEDWEDAARDDPESRLWRPQADRLVDITAEPHVRVGWRFDHGAFWPPVAAEG